MRRFVFFLLIVSTLAVADDLLPPTKLQDLDYEQPLLTGDYDPSLPTPEQILGFRVGQRTASPEQIVQAISTWAEASDRIQLVEYARTHENRPLHYLIISSAQHLARLDEIQADIARLADARSTTSAQASAVIERLPAIAWMAYSIHGNETSGADAALAAIYHLAASQDPEVIDLLDKEIVIIDPLMNPDGRARFIKGLEEARGTAPNVDEQSMLHDGQWPFGRTNHYLFDLNRDFTYLVHPETRGRVRALNHWRPQLFIDGHEMGAQGTYLFSPSREPNNRHSPGFIARWNDVIAQDQAAAFDQHAWPYYTGEWNENLYVGYSNYTTYRGSIFVLYEQARIAEDGVSRPEGSILTYRQSVHHQLTSTFTNLKTLAAHSQEIYRDYFADRQLAVASKGPYADRSFAILPTANRSRLKALIELLQAQDIELFTAIRDIPVIHAINHLGQTLPETTLPAGTIVIPNRQPEARLVAAMLEFDTQISDSVLVGERQRLLRNGGSLMYDVTAWNLTMMYGLEALTVPQHMTTHLKPYVSVERSRNALLPEHIAYATDGADDRSTALAARLMETGIQVRVIDKATNLGDVALSRGSVFVYRNDNRTAEDLSGQVHAIAEELDLTVHGISSGWGAGDLPDIGGRHVRLLQRPSVALMSRRLINPNDYGTIWHSIDKHLGIRHSHLDQEFLRWVDLRRYNVLIVPDRWAGSLEPGEVSTIKTWVEAGGTLIAVGQSTGDATNAENELGSVRQLSDTFSEMAKYDHSLQREWLATRRAIDFGQVRSHGVAMEVEYPSAAETPGEEELAALDRWQSLFMPRGAFLATRTDQKHWLTFGIGPILPVLIGRSPMLMSDDGSQAIVRAGVYQQMSDKAWQKVVADADGEVPSRQIGWATLPERQQLSMRMSGLLWPEASQRMANAALVTREGLGDGQIILFAFQPNFRGATRGTNRLLLNAIVYGPGLGTNRVITPH